MNPLLAQVVMHERLSTMLPRLLWQAYGKPLKIIALVALAIMVIGPLVAFVRKLVR